MKKKIEVVELNKNEEEIVLKEHQSPWKIFWNKYNRLFLLILLILSFTTLITALIVTISNLSTSEKLIIKEVSIYTDLDINNSDVTANPMAPLTDETAKKIFQNSGLFKKNGEVLLVKTVSKGKYTIKFYSDYTAIKTMKNSNLVTKIQALDEKKYGIKENGVTDSKAKTIDITVTSTKEYYWGIVTYYSDGSAEISGKNINMYVRNANDITKEYIANHKVSYFKETVNIKGTKLNYFYDGTIEVIKDNTSYLVRSENDLNITDNDVTFKNGNEATIKESIKLSGGIKIDYYTDGGAIITDGNKRISVRKSNSIIIKDNKIYEIVDNIYVTVSKVSNDGNIIYYTNGSAVIKNYNGKTVYVEENSNIKFQNNRITDIGSSYEELTTERVIGSDKILTFETISVVETKDYIAIVPKDDVLYDTDGSLKELIVGSVDDENKPITITNDTNEVIKYRLVIERSNRTTLDSEYVKYQLSVGQTYIEPTKLNKNVWTKDDISEGLSIQGTNYILLERTLQPMETNQINIMFWTDYDTIPNTMQNKYFYGTIRLYAWQEIETNI